jgi:hypothetical protein
MREGRMEGKVEDKRGRKEMIILYGAICGMPCTASRIGEKNLSQSNQERLSEFCMKSNMDILHNYRDNVKNEIIMIIEIIHEFS